VFLFRVMGLGKAPCNCCDVYILARAVAVAVRKQRWQVICHCATATILGSPCVTPAAVSMF
jgi:hypothetical protein